MCGILTTVTKTKQRCDILTNSHQNKAILTNSNQNKAKVWHTGIPTVTKTKQSNQNKAKVWHILTNSNNIKTKQMWHTNQQ